MAEPVEDGTTLLSDDEEEEMLHRLLLPEDSLSLKSQRKRPRPSVEPPKPAASKKSRRGIVRTMKPSWPRHTLPGR